MEGKKYLERRNPALTGPVLVPGMACDGNDRVRYELVCAWHGCACSADVVNKEEGGGRTLDSLHHTEKKNGGSMPGDT